MPRTCNPGDPLHHYFNEAGHHIRAVIAAEIRAGQDTGEIRSDIDADLKAMEIVAFSIGIETQWLAEPNLIDRQKVHQSFVRALLDDLTRADAPRKATKKTKTPTSKTAGKTGRRSIPQPAAISPSQTADGDHQSWGVGVSTCRGRT